MRTKKILSILLAILMVAGVFGITAMADSTPDLEAIFGDESAELALLAKDGFPSEVELDVRAGANWGSALVAWTPFTNTADSTKTYAALRSAGKASIDWTVITYGKTDGKEDLTKPAEMTVYSNKADAVGKAFKVYEFWNGAEEQLYIEQGATAYYGTVTVTAKVTVTQDGMAGEKTSAAKAITLADQTSFNELIADAKEIAAQTDRYSKDYIKELEEMIDAALFYNSVKLDSSTTVTISNVMKTLQAKMDAKEDNYILTGWDWLDSKLPNGLMKAIWAIKDFFDGVSKVFKPMVDFFGQVGSALGYIMPLFTALGKLLGL